MRVGLQAVEMSCEARGGRWEGKRGRGPCVDRQDLQAPPCCDTTVSYCLCLLVSELPLGRKEDYMGGALRALVSFVDLAGRALEEEMVLDKLHS